MGNTSSQVHEDAPDTPNVQGIVKNIHDDNEAAASQIFAENQSSAAHSPEAEKKKKRKKSKKERRKSGETHADANAVKDEVRAGDAAPKDFLIPVEDAGTGQAPVPSPNASGDENEARKKKKKKDKGTATNGSADIGAAAHVAIDDAQQTLSKKRKRNSQGASRTNGNTTSEPQAPVDTNPTPAQEELDTEEQSHKKQRKSKRVSASTASVKIPETPIPISTFEPEPAEEPKASSTKKSKKKSDGTGRSKKRPTEEQAPHTTRAVAQENTTSLPDDQPADASSRKHQKAKMSRHSDAAAQDTGTVYITNTIHDAVIDPALLPEPQQEDHTEDQNARSTEDSAAHKKHKKSKKSRHSDSAAQGDASASMDITMVDAPPPSQPHVVGNASNGVSASTEVTGEVASKEHKKREKRRRQSEPAAASTPVKKASHSEPATEPKPKKRKKQSGTAPMTRAESAEPADTILHRNGWNRVKGTEDFPNSGPYTKKEVETLNQAIESYREFNDLSKREVNDLVQAGVFSEVHGKSCKKFWDEICPCLPNRWSRETIIKFVRRKWHNFEKRGKWDPDEDQMLKEAYERTPGQWTKIGEAVGRFADDCRDRWRNYLSCSETMASKRWHDSEVNELLNVVQECLNRLLERLPDDRRDYWHEELQCTEGREIWTPKDIQNFVRKFPDCLEALRIAFDEKHPRQTKQKRATEKRRGSSETDGSVVINWDLVSEKMGKKRSRLQIMSKWKALEHSYSQAPKETFFTEANHWRVENGQKWAEQMLPGDKYNIVRAMVDLGLTNEERIIWNTVAHHDLVKLKWAHQAKMTFLGMKGLVPPHDSLPVLLQSLLRHFETNHARELDQHWRYEGRPSRSTLKQKTTSPGPLDWRGQMRSTSYYKSNERVTDDDEEDGYDGDGDGGVKFEERGVDRIDSGSAPGEDEDEDEDDDSSSSDEE